MHFKIIQNDCCNTIQNFAYVVEELKYIIKNKCINHKERA